MEVLRISMRAHRDWRADDEEDEDRDGPLVILDSSFLSENASRLRSVWLEGCFLPWTSPFLRNLTDLKISLEQTASPASLLGSASDLIRSLQAMPALQSLNLLNCFPPDLRSHPTSAVISFPLLTDLEMSGTVSECKAMFKMLDTPSGTSLILSCSTTNQTPAECCTVLPTVSAYLLRANNNGLALKTFALAHDEASLEIVMMIRDVIPFDFEPKFKLCFSWPASPITPDLPTLEKVCDVFAPYLNSLEAVRVRNPAWRPDHWTTYFSQSKMASRVHGSGFAG
ncbi:hypothetical protein OF83DRAFT_1223607 [Amylostereum chailletii]|nr:hypothetical protein OF83DRAFT_1223607 [Amylostereum chailletii]